MSASFGAIHFVRARVEHIGSFPRREGILMEFLEPWKGLDPVQTSAAQAAGPGRLYM